MHMKINYDLLIAVMSYLQGSSLIRMLHTCRALYAAGAPFLLHPPVVLRSRARVLSFCRYILIEPARFQLLLSLEIRAPGRFDAGPKADLFLTMLMHAKHLETLKVLNTDILRSDARIPAAVAALTTLKSVAFPALNEAATEILQCSRSSLTKVEIGFWGEETFGPGDPVPLLTRFAHSLRELRVTYAEFMQPDLQYPHVDILLVDDCRFTLAEPLIRCFPKTRDLSLWTGQEDEDLEDDEIEEHRQTNIQAQERACWGWLEHLRGDIRSLYLLGLTCQVGHVDVQSTFLTASRADELSTLLSVGRSSALSVRFRVSEFHGTILHRVLHPVKDSLLRLNVYLNFCELGTRYREDDLIVSFPLLYLSDHAHTDSKSTHRQNALSSALDQTVIESLVVHLSFDDPKVTLLAHLDPERLAEAVLQHSQFIQYIALMDPDGYLVKYWAVVAETRALRKLDTAEALAKIFKDTHVVETL